jgi:hypothetical protein
MADLAEAVSGPDGVRYYAPSTAAKRIGATPRQIDTLIRPKLDRSTPLRFTRDPVVLALHRGPGRHPSYLVAADDVERIRNELLRDLGVAQQIDTLQAEVIAVRAAWEREVLPLRQRVSDLEEQRVATLQAFERRLDATIAQSEADREFLRALRTTAYPE